MAKESANNGFIVLDRQMLVWQHITEPVLVQVFVYLLLKANHQAKWWNGHKCERGATFVSIRTMCEELSMSPNTAIKALRTLEETGEIKRIQVNQKLSKTKILNYSKFQDIRPRSVSKSVTQTITQGVTQTITKQQRKQREQYKGDNNIAHTHTHEEIIADLLKSQSLIEAYCKNEGITPDQFKRLAEAVSVEWSLTGEHYPTISETKQRLLAHIRMKAQATNVVSATFDERKAKFIGECKALLDKGYPKSEVAEFATYYSQPTTDGRMLFETYKGWDTLTRFQINQKRKSS